MKVSPHTHVESFLTGSTVETMIARAKALGRTHFTHTDHGHLSSAFKTYTVAKKAGLSPILGIEIYFKDSNCPVIGGTNAARCKYFTTTLYCHDQDAYQALCKMVSRIDFPTIELYEEEQQLWNWTDLMEMAKYNVSVVLGGVHCMVSKVALAGRPDLAEMVLSQLKGIFGKERIFAALLCEPWKKKWNQVVAIHYQDESASDYLLANDQVSTDIARRIKAIDLTVRKGHSFIKSRTSNNTHYDVNKTISSIKLHKGFLPLPGGDVTFKVNKILNHLASTYGIKVIATDYAYYANKEDKIVQTMKLEGNDKLDPNLHMKTEDEILEYLTNILGLSLVSAQSIVANTNDWADQFNNFKLEYTWRLAEVGGNPLELAMNIIKENGRMKWDNPMWVARLKEELQVIAKNPKKDLTAYFLPIRDVLNHYKENGQLTGPGRGSAGGSLFCYLLGITQVDPFKYDLPFQRFFSLDRIMMNELPDIDVDLEDRELLVGKDTKSGYLYGRYGDKAAQISTRTTVRLKSAIKDTNRYFKGKVEEEIEKLTEGLPAPPQGVTDFEAVFGYFDKDSQTQIPGLIDQSEELQAYVKDRPEEWDIVSKAMGLTRAFSRHASAFVLSDIPIKEVMPTRGGNITQYAAKAVEASKLIKYDFLVVTQLKDLRVCMDLINKKNDTSVSVGHFNDDRYGFSYIWDLPEDEAVFKSIWGGACETLFQINSRSMIPVVMEVLPKNIMDLATILALVRPGPMDFIDPDTDRNMVEEYILRRRGEGKVDIQELMDLLPETYGIITFQEQLGKIARDLCGFSGPEAEMLRKHMAKKNMPELQKLKPSFISGAIKKISPEVAEGIWERMVTFGRYGFSIIHAVEYALITYASMYFKHYYPLEWWAAILTNADEKEITGKFWPFVKDKVSPPDINLSTDTMVVDYANGIIRSKLGVIRGIGDVTIEPLVENRPYKNIQDFVNKEVAGSSLSCKLIHVGVLDSLFPPKCGLVDKLQMYGNAVEVKKYYEKVEEAKEKGKKVKALQPKQGKVPEEYLNLTPLQDAAKRKAVLPTLPIDLHGIGKRYSKVLVPYTHKPLVMSHTSHETILVDGNTLERLDGIKSDQHDKDIYFAATCYVIDAKEFSYSKGTKRALKLTLDSDGYINEKVLWPDYNSGNLMYPKELKKGAIATFFFRKRSGKEKGRDDLQTSISGIVIET